MQDIFKQYEETVTHEPTNLRVVGVWAMEQGLWQPHRADIISQFADDMARALREEYRTDEDGRRYRSKHAVRTSAGGIQRSFWADIDTAPRSHIEKAFAQRRQQIIGDCYQLKMDVDHYNQKNHSEQPIQMVFDFTTDLKEIEVLEEIGAKVA
ncbi:MAG: hypothetical protein HYS41_04270 [Candidatus Omnitrophica bacterium]|nr:hypothetical protein [Candidatus Omnitrophota bacterium]